MLHPSQRTSARAALLAEAIFEYAYESVPRRNFLSSRRVALRPEESLRVCERLGEFIQTPGGSSGVTIMKWLHDNLLPEAWTYPQDMQSLVQEFLRDD